MHQPIDDARQGRSRRTRRRGAARPGAYGASAFLGLGLLVGQCAPQCAPPPATAPAPPPAPGLPAELQRVVDLTNQRRAERGIALLTVNQALVNAAQGHSNDQAARDTMTHTGSDGSDAGGRIARQGYRAASWAENVAAGYRDATSVVDAWWASSTHRTNMLRTNVTEIGVGLAYAADGTAYWTQVFASRA